MKKLILFASLLLAAVSLCPAYGADLEPAPGPAQEAQRFEIVVDSHSFKPDRITVTAGKPVEITLRSVTSMIPHNFSIDDPESGLDVHVDVPAGKDVTVSFTPVKPGEFTFYCNKKGIFGSHLKKGMKGTIEVM